MDGWMDALLRKSVASFIYRKALRSGRTFILHHVILQGTTKPYHNIFIKSLYVYKTNIFFKLHLLSVFERTLFASTAYSFCFTKFSFIYLKIYTKILVRKQKQEWKLSYRDIQL